MNKIRTTAEWQRLDADRHLHPFTDFGDYQRNPGRIIDRAEHIYIYDTDGNQMLDAMSGLWCCSFGYSQPTIAASVSEQFKQLPYYNNFFQCSNTPAVELADRLVNLTPKQFTHVFFTNSGSESIETAIKIVLAYQRAAGQAQRNRLISRERAYHGVNMGGVSLAGMVRNRETFGLTFLTSQSKVFRRY